MKCISYESYHIRHLDAIAAGTVHSRMSSVGPKDLIGPPFYEAGGGEVVPPYRGVVKSI